MAANLNPQAWGVPQLTIHTPPDPTFAEVNDYRQNLNHMQFRVSNAATFLGLLNLLVIPNVPVGALTAADDQALINANAHALHLYAASLANAQNLLLIMTQRAIQPPAPPPPPAPPAPPPPRPTIKVAQPEYDGTPGEKARAFVTACQTYRSLRPGDFVNDEVFIAWALACISDDSKAASWKAHWLTVRTNNISAGDPQPVNLTQWDDFAREFLGKFLDPSETHRMQRRLMDIKQKTSCRDHTQEFNRTTLLAGMQGNDALPWIYRQSLKDEIQRELLRETFNTLEALQAAAIRTDDLLFSFKKQNQERAPRKPDPPRRQTQQYYPPQQQQPQPHTPPGDPNAMELDRLSAEEYRRRRSTGLCFKCGKKGFARDCPNHNRPPNTPRRPFRQQGRVQAIEAPPTPQETATAATTQTQERDGAKSPSLFSVNLTQDAQDFLRG